MAYSSSSPWKNTPLGNGTFGLGYFQIRSVPGSADDTPYIIDPQYNHRPDLLAYDLYGTPKLWWIFAQRNMNVLEDPIYDFESGVEILLMSADSVSAMLE